MIHRIGWMTVLMWVCLQPTLPGWAKEDVVGEWPREVKVSQGVVVIYQPQPEKLEGNRLSGRAAVSVELKGSTEPVFGAVWFEARLDTDRGERTAIIEDVSVTRVRFPEQDEEKAKKLGALLEKEIPKWNLPISMDRLMTTLEHAETREKAAEKINTDPPKILFVTEPAVLINLDGKPRLQPEDGTELMRVVNTPFTILFVSAKKTYYLYADKDTWYTAGDITGEWKVAQKIPSEVASRAPKEEADPEEQGEEDQEKPGPSPRVILSTEPTELISCTGKPEYTPISGTDLLYMSNTDSDVLMHIKKQQHYILISGRWYASAKLEGPWQYVPGEKLPPDFARIPEDSQMGTVLYAVPGTDVAKDAVMDAQVPQTASIDRKNATLTVDYDGNPKFETISGTKMVYAVNTATPVIRVGKTYFACDQAVWFTSYSATGSWLVATSVPDEIYTIPPECPIYHVTFVRVYSSTPEVVYIGYTSGYTTTYVYHNTVVYGTGYWYPYWYGRYYYPRPATWGFHVRWNPWTGFRFGLSYSNGPFRFTIGGGGWYRGGWWGPGRYRGYRRGYRHGYRRGRNAGYRAGYRSGSRTSAGQNMYRNQRNQSRVKGSAPKPGIKGNARTASKRPNNVYSDRNGNVHRKTDAGWQKRTKDGWQSEKGQSARKQKMQTQGKQTAPSSQVRSSPKSSNKTRDLNRSYQTRQRGNQRSQSYNKARTRSSGRSRGGRGGGRRR